MTPALEYLLRVADPTKACFSRASLFLTSFDLKKHLIVTIVKNNINYSEYKVTHWKLWQHNDKNNMPEKEKRLIPQSELSSNDFVIVPGFRLLKYKENPYSRGSKPILSDQQARLKQLEYRDQIDQFCCTPKNYHNRTTWLIARFSGFYGLKDSLHLCGIEKPSFSHLEYIVCLEQRPELADTVGHWSRKFLRQELECELASEIIFGAAYSKAEEKLKSEEDALRKPQKNFKAFIFDWA